jgi:hypothetical protein
MLVSASLSVRMKRAASQYGAAAKALDSRVIAITDVRQAAAKAEMTGSGIAAIL